MDPEPKKSERTNHNPASDQPTSKDDDGDALNGGRFVDEYGRMVLTHISHYLRMVRANLPPALTSEHAAAHRHQPSVAGWGEGSTGKSTTPRMMEILKALENNHWNR